MSIALARRLDRLENGNGENDPYAGLAQYLGKALREADAREAAGLPPVNEGEHPVERYHRIKFSEDPAEREEAERLSKKFWPHLHR